MLMALVLWKHGGKQNTKQNTKLANMWVSGLWVVFWMDLCVFVKEPGFVTALHTHIELPEKAAFQYGFVRSSQMEAESG